jgi:asparagine synthase (glutamine-hydrolysing)
MARLMEAAMWRFPWLEVERWSDNTFAGGRIHLGVLDPTPQPKSSPIGANHHWFDGELYCVPGGSCGAVGARDLERLLENDGQLLVDTDGLFVLAQYNPAERRLVLANDRMGYRPLYYLDTPHWFAYASEVKALLPLLDRLPRVDEVALRQFIGFGHLLGDRTWWESIRVLPAASHWTVGGRSSARRTYWGFDDIAPEPASDAEVLEQLSTLWSESVRTRSRGGMMPLLLSGGLDSRLLLAELSEQGREVVAFTFGSSDCSDIALARECARLAGCGHRAHYMDSENWWQGREEAIWQIDGLANALDLHSAGVLRDFRMGARYSPQNIAGDLLFGGSYLSPESESGGPPTAHALLLSRCLENPLFPRDEIVSASLPDVVGSLRGPSTDCFYLRERVRRSTVYGPGSSSPHCETVYPSMSLPLLQLVYGRMSDRQRRGSRLYNNWLLSRYPSFFANIPWQKTGRGLQETLGIYARREVLTRTPYVRRRWETRTRSGIADYPALTRSMGVQQILLREPLLMDELMGGAVRRAVMSQGEHPMHVYVLLGLLTVETYLRQVTGGLSGNSAAAPEFPTLPVKGIDDGELMGIGAARIGL